MLEFERVIVLVFIINFFLRKYGDYKCIFIYMVCSYIWDINLDVMCKVIGYVNF